MRTKAAVFLNPITLEGNGIPQLLYGEDLEEYFHPANLDFSGFSRAQYEKGASLPEGVYRFTIEVLDLIENRMRRIAQATCEAFEATCEFDFIRRYPPTVNHERETQFTRAVLSSLVGDRQVLDFEGTMGAEDFSFLLEKVPGCYILIGNGDGAHRIAGHGDGPCMLHNPSYDFNDALIPLGGSMWVRLVERWFSTAF